MMILSLTIGASLSPLWRARNWAFERLLLLNFVAGDLRWQVVALALRAFGAVWSLGKQQLVLLAGKAGSGQAGFEAARHAADSMVAAGGQ